MINTDHMDAHLKDKLPFFIDLYKKDVHILKSDNPLYLSSTVERVEIEIDTNPVISDFLHRLHTIH